MSKTVFIAGVIGLVFGFLFSGTLGINFFPEDDPNNNLDNNPIVDDNEDDDEENMMDDEEEVDPLAQAKEDFRVAYGLTESVFVPISGDDAYAKIANGDTFILYAGFSACPYCQAYIPVLQQAAENQGVDMIFHVSTTSSANRDFVDDVNVRSTPTVYYYKDGVLVETAEGYRTLGATEQLIQDHFLN